MLITPIFFSIIFILSSSISMFFGIYILYIDPKAHTNRIFFLVTLLLSLWAFGFSIAVSAPSIEICMLFRRISAVGWGSIYGVLLHFFLVQTNKKYLLNKWWTYLLLYFPSAVTVYVFSISNTLVQNQYNFVHTPFGWTNIAVNNFWDGFFYFYYITYFAIGLFLVWHWGKKSSVPYDKNQALIIFSSFLAAILLGTVTDVLFNSYFNLKIPQLAPVIMLIPITAIYYCIKRYQFMNPNVSEDESILKSDTRSKIYNYLAIAFFAGGLLHFTSLYFLYEDANLKSVLGTSAAIAMVGFLILLVNHLKIDDSAKDLINTIILSLFIPIATLRFIEFGSITVWAFPFVLIIISLVFNRRLTLAVIAVSIILTQILVWILAPQVYLRVDGADYAGRIGLFCISIWLAFYINKVYVLRLKENIHQARYQKMISEISSDYVSVNQNNLDEKTVNMLMQIGTFYKANRTYILLFDTNCNNVIYRREWSAQGRGSETGIENDVPIEVPITSMGKVIGLLGFDIDISLKKWQDQNSELIKIITNIIADALSKVEAEKEINLLAYYDYLTKLPNRLFFTERVDEEIIIAQKTERQFGLVFLDIDSFKSVNDTMGHEAGDEILCKVAQKLLTLIGESGIVSRFGGDEFLLMINGLPDMGALILLAENIVDMFRQPFILNGQEFFLTASSGIAIYPKDGKDPKTLIKNADIAMYTAKENGKNQYVFCSSKMKEDVEHVMKLTNLLYHAQERNELVLHYQPQISLHTQKIIGLEVLLRWNHPELGMLYPDSFISIAEQTGIINSIGEWVIKTACSQNLAWQNSGLSPIPIAVNLSIHQFQDPNLTENIQNLLRSSGLDARYLELEITESMVMKEPEYVTVTLNSLKSLGVTIAIDDFGTEYSSLSRLKTLPFDRIKMDKQFVAGIEGSQKDLAIANVIIDLAKNLGVNLIAEGLETENQLAFLKKRNCDAAQGYYYFKPMPADQIEILLRNHTI